MLWKGTAWPWVGGGMRRDDFQTSSIQRAAGRLRQSAWLWSVFFLSQESMYTDSICSPALLVSHSVPLAILRSVFSFWPLPITLLLCCFQTSLPLPCQDDLRVPALLFLFYCFAASMRCKFIDSKGHDLCASLSSQASTRSDLQDMHCAWCALFKDSEALAQVCSHGSGGDREADVHLQLTTASPPLFPSCLCSQTNVELLQCHLDHSDHFPVCSFGSKCSAQLESYRYSFWRCLEVKRIFPHDFQAIVTSFLYHLSIVFHSTFKGTGSKWLVTFLDVLRMVLGSCSCN